MSLHASRLEAHLIRSWSARGPLACLLWPVSLLFGALAAVRRILYSNGLLKVVRLPVPLIVVGNIFIGGTGKTPMTIWLVETMRAAGYRPGVISRGYGNDRLAVQPVTAATRVAEAGDEPLLIVRRTGVPLMVGRDRVAAAEALLRAHPEVDLIISDDGLQHYRLARDIEIILSDGRGAGNGWLLPAGPLREPVSRRRDFSVRNLPAGHGTSMGPAEFIMQLAGSIAERLSDRSQRLALNQLPRGRLLAAAGIGHPGRFFAQLRAAGLDFAEMPLPDHFAYSENPFAKVTADIILITEKDAVKCSEHAELSNDPRLWVVPVTANIDAALAEQIVEKLRGYATA